jgi:hypothetical protein
MLNYHSAKYPRFTKEMSSYCYCRRCKFLIYPNDSFLVLILVAEPVSS